MKKNSPTPKAYRHGGTRIKFGFDSYQKKVIVSCDSPASGEAGQQVLWKSPAEGEAGQREVRRRESMEAENEKAENWQQEICLDRMKKPEGLA